LNRDRLAELSESARDARVEVLLDLLAELETIQQASGRNLNLQMAMENALLSLRDALGVKS
jgi:hypothetical protein